MRENPMKAALKRGEAQIGTWINLVHNPAVLSLLKAAGLDYARVDMEHTAVSVETISHFAVLARALSFPVTVRPPEGTREWITRLLDAGVWNVHIPQVDTPEQAEAIAQAARYAPEGARGMIGVGPGTDFESGGDPRENLAFANAQIHVTIMLETREAFTHLNEIASVPGIDALTLGPSDLAQDLGVFGTPGQAEVLDEHRYRMTESALKHGKDVAMRVETVAQAKQWIEAGAKLLSYSSDVAVLKGGFRTAMSELRPR